MIVSIYTEVAVLLGERLVDGQLEDKDPECAHYGCKNPLVANLLY
ncbi:MAG: hypothetical protein P0116_10610 [Candidatus Nitrosocosmicus sp.]|nr:hypothetical protein [Candidatus Nitrosocosmicus sp.]